MTRELSLTLNGQPRRTMIHDNDILLDVLRDNLAAKTVKAACWRGECGLCTVLFNDKPVKTCLVLGAEAEGADIVTAEGLADDVNLAAVQKSFVEHGALQCGFCTPSFVLVAHHLLKVKPKPTVEELKEYLSGHICRCGAYKQMIEAIMKLAEEHKEEIPVPATLPKPKRKKNVE